MIKVFIMCDIDLDIPVCIYIYICVCVSVCCSGWFCAQFYMKKSNIGFWVMYMHGWAGKHIAKTNM